MKQKILKILLKNNIMANKDVLDFIISKENPIEFINEILSKENLPIFLSLDELNKFEIKEVSINTENFNEQLISEENKKIEEQEEASTTQKTKKKEVNNDFSKISKEEQKLNNKEIIENNKINIIKDITGESTSEGKIDDFKKYFNDRFLQLKKIIKNNPQMTRSMPITFIKKHNVEDAVKVIGIVRKKRITAKGNLIFTLEDDNDEISCMIFSNTPQINKDLLVDEVVGIEGKRKPPSPWQRFEDTIIVEDIIRPNIQQKNRMGKSPTQAFAAFLSDIHIGSSTFLKGPWERFLKWLNDKNEISKRIKYLIITGDNVDGIGIYPNQEDELIIFDIYAQYEALAKELGKVPSNINIIILPGNHDAIRPAEPQPALPDQIQDLFNSDIIFVGNPCYFTICGIEILAYHGRSMDDYITQIRSLNYSNPIESMKEMLKRRHLATVYGSRTPIAPEHKDYLVIDKIPDIFVTGHVHSAGIDRYQDILLINASTWQSQTTYQKMLNFNPIPAKLPVVDLQSLQYKMIDFMQT